MELKLRSTGTKARKAGVLFIFTVLGSIIRDGKSLAVPLCRNGRSYAKIIFNTETNMKRISLLIFTVILCIPGVLAQSSDTLKRKKLYDPSEDAKVEIAEAVKQAEIEGKHVFLQIGGNWCGWCIAFDNKVKSNDTLRNVLEKNFIVYHVNYSRENMNEDVMASLGFPQRFGFPVFVILDSKGNRIHTQNSAYLEEGKGHSTSKILEFLNHWSPAAIDAKQYNQ